VFAAHQVGDLLRSTLGGWLGSRRSWRGRPGGRELEGLTAGASWRGWRRGGLLRRQWRHVQPPGL